mgnify:CR=1 FL=1
MNVSVNLEKLQEFVNEKGYVNMVVSPRKEVGQYGETHSVTLNDWKPDGQQAKPQAQKSDISVSDIPF